MSGPTQSTKFDQLPALVREEKFLGLSVASCLVFLCFGNSMMARLSNPLWLTVIFVWLFVAALGSVFCVVRHADHIAHRLGEPYGTLLLTLAVTAIEVISISAMMLHGENNPTLVRDTLFAVVMIILNGMVGLSLLVGGWRHREQQYNLQGANAYLGVIIPLAVLSLVYLAEQLARPIDHLVEVVRAPAAVGGVIIAMLVGTPEAISAVQAARANHLQRSVNIFLGSVLATIGLTVPTMLVISHLTGRVLFLGLQNADLLLLPLTLAVSIVTFSSGRTNILQGMVHLLLFAAYVVLIFQG